MVHGGKRSTNGYQIDMSLFDLTNKVAVVAGGNGLVGKECVAALMNHGAKVISLGRSKSTYNKLCTGYFECDISDQHVFTNTLNDIKKNFGNPYIYVNCAITRPMKRFLDDTIENWDKSIEVNARSAYIGMKIMAEEMSKEGGGSIINISSIYGIRGPNQEVYENCDFETEPDYCYNKAALCGLTRYFASKYARHGVRVNSVALGGVYNNQAQVFLDNYKRRCPIGRLAKPSEIRTTILYLASPHSTYVTGTTINVDGGWANS